ncbi:aminotransferase-like domain-containing protein [Parenemella sanctibonifatiensis]
MTPSRESSSTGSATPARTQQRRGTRLDSYVDRYAERTQGMTASAIRALFAVANRPEVVSLAGGMPNIGDLPLPNIAEGMERMIRDHGPQVMQYGSGQGEPFIREHICTVMKLEGIDAHPDDVTVTCGSQQALDLVTRLFCDPGDPVVVEAPSYVGALGTFRAYQCDVRHAAMDDDGLEPNALRATLQQLASEGKRAKFLYTIPNFQNPTGLQQSLLRRQEILAIAEEFDLLVIEDNPYGMLSFEADPLPAMRSLDHDRVIYLGSFSKTFAPGFRVGWALAPHAVREKLVLAQESATLCPPVFSQYAIANYLENNDWRGQIEVFKSMYVERRDALLSGLKEYMPPGCEWNTPRGGFFVWMQVPEGLDTQAMLPRAVTARVAFVPGTGFYADGLGSRYMRLSYCFPTAERIVEGTRRLGEVLTREAEMLNTFGIEGRRLPPDHGFPGPETN